MMRSSKKGHAICFPLPAQGHISAMMKLAKLLHHKGFHITFVHSEHNYRRLLTTNSTNSLKGLPGFHFRTIPDGLIPPSEPGTSQDVSDVILSLAKNGLSPLRDLISELNDESADVPPVSCFVSDGVLSFALDAAQEVGIPGILFWPISACSLLCLFHFPHLLESGLVPFKDASFLTNGDIDTVIDWIPGIERITLRDFPSQIRIMELGDFYAFLMNEITRASKASAILLNTFDELEQRVLDSLRFMLNPATTIYTVGPLQLLLNQFPVDDPTVMGSSLWKEDRGVIDWLDSKSPRSVVYVNFGSITVMTNEQLCEFAWGLANSMQTFLWIVRPDLINSEESVVLPPAFLASVAGRGMLASWCAQEQVLNHPSIGGFLTHSGWNSTMESLGSGVPMICWPDFSDQPTNCFYSCTHWGIGMEIDNDVKSEEVEKLVRELMEGEKGKEMKRRVMEWKKKAEEATSPCGGSSYSNFNKMIRDLLL